VAPACHHRQAASVHLERTGLAVVQRHDHVGVARERVDGVGEIRPAELVGELAGVMGGQHCPSSAPDRRV
jgi:hypothetical protein